MFLDFVLMQFSPFVEFRQKYNIKTTFIGGYFEKSPTSK